MRGRALRTLGRGAWGLLLLQLAKGLLWAQCAMCRTGLMNSPEGQQWASGFNRGILFLLLVPFGITGGIAALIWRASRRKSCQELPRVERARAEAPRQAFTSSPASG